MARKTPYQAAATGAQILDGLQTKRDSALRVMLTTVFNALLNTLYRYPDPVEEERKKFIETAKRMEAAAATAIARLSATAYRQMLQNVYEESTMPQIIPAETDFGWGEVFDTAYEELDEGRDPQDITTDLYKETWEDFDDKFDEVESDARGRVYESSKVTHWRRVIHPELSKSGVCGLCLVASTQPYSTPNLKKIHSHCKCTVLPLTADYDLGDALGKLELGDLYRAASDDVDPRSQSTDGYDLKRVRVNAKGEIIAERGTRNKQRSEKGGSAAGANRSDKQRAADLKSSGALGFWDNPDNLRKQLKIVTPLEDTPWKRNYLAKVRKRLSELDSTSAA